MKGYSMSSLKDSLLVKTQEPEPAVAVLPNDEDDVPEGSYKGIFLHQIIRKDGTVFKPDVFGCFTPETAEEKELCEYYVTVGKCSK